MTLLALSAAWVGGAYLAVCLETPPSALGLFLLAAVFLLLRLAAFGPRSSLPALLVVVLLLGMLRGELFDEHTSELVAYHGRGPVGVRGVVVSDPEATGDATRLRVRMDRVGADDDWTAVSGDARVTLRPSSELALRRVPPYFRYGDRLLLEGALASPPELEEFDYPAYLARQGIRSVMSFPEATLLDEGQGLAFYRWLYGVRRRIADSLARTVPEPQASVGQALLVGLRDGIPEDLEQDFRDTGTSHVLAISGLHVGILLGIGLAASAAVFGRRRQIYLVLPFALIWLYALISGMSPSVTRAAIMGSVYLAALLLGRPRSILPALGLAAAVMVGANPNVLWSVSFQLSFVAMAGIAVLAEPLTSGLRALYQRRLRAGHPASTVLEPAIYIAAMTIAATVATLPLLAFHFQRVSLAGVPTTALVMPALPVVLLTQALAGFLGLVSIGLAEPLGWIAWLATGYVTGVVGLVARVPGISVETGNAVSFLVWAYYGVLVLAYLATSLHRPLRRRLMDFLSLVSPPPPARRGVSWLPLSTAVSVAALVWVAAFSVPDARLHVAFIDVGQGDAALITTPGGLQVLVDGGPNPARVVRFLGEKMPFRDRTIELVVLTHLHDDHVSGLIEVLKRYDVLRVLEREVEHDTPTYQAWRRAVAEEGADVVQARAGELIDTGDGVSLRVVGPPERPLQGTASDVDNASVVLRLVYGEVSFLLTGDMFADGEARLVGGDVDPSSDVLKVGHHGSRTSSSPAFLDRVGPAVAVISAGEGNRFGHPHAETLDALRARVPEDLILLTMEKGTIEFVTDGKRLNVNTER